ncbi:hypothetical protein Mapa_001576 [Marchantia paleacea]|nr:hypothetical protein Mapa_001576 [Marchantia paleacea]
MAISRIALLPSVTEKVADKSIMDVAEEIKKIVNDHGSTFLRIQLVVVLPITALMMFSDYIFQKFANSHLPVPTPHPLADTESMVTFGRLFPPAQMFRHILLAFQTSHVLLTLTAAIAVGWFNLYISLHYIAANVYAVISFHNGKTLAFTDVLHAVPKLRSRLIVTGYWGYLFTFAASLPLLLYDVMSWSKVPAYVFVMFGIMIAAVCFVVSFFTSPIFQVANCIACCEEKTGFASFLKSFSLFDRTLLLKASFPLELFLRGLGSGAYTVLGGVHMGPMSYSFSVVAELIICSLLTQLSIVCWTFVYIWSKEYHEESVDMIVFPDDQFRGPFQRIGTVRQSAQDVEIGGLESAN